MSETPVIPTAEKLACAERELKMRKKVYPRWVEEGKMSEGKATHELACIEALITDYRGAAEKERLI